jgi:sec-independent protein translocase protein TatA
MAEALAGLVEPARPSLRCYNRPQGRGRCAPKGVIMNLVALFGPIGLPEMLIILAIVVLIFGANRLPELGKGIGAGIKNFKAGLKDSEQK